MVYHECKLCNYSSPFVSNYKNHLLTKKHCRNLKNSQNDFKINENIKYDCQNCGKVFNTLSSLNKHFRICNLENKIIKNNITEDNGGEIKKYKQINTNKSIIESDSAPNKSNWLFNKNKLNEYEISNSHLTDIKNIESKKKTFICQYCLISCSKKSNLNRHYKTCSKINLSCSPIEKDDNTNEILEIAKLKQIIEEKEKQILIKENEKLKAVIEKDQELMKEKDKAIEIAKNSNTSITNIQNNNTKTINFLNDQYGDMIAMEKFLYNLQHHEQLTDEERENLLTSYKENGIDVFARNFSYIMKQNCRRQLAKEGITDMKLLPLFCSDGSLRSHKEKGKNGWKPHYDNQSINQMLNISNDQVYETYQQLIPITGKDRNRVYNVVKRDNHIEKIKYLKD